MSFEFVKTGGVTQKLVCESPCHAQMARSVRVQPVRILVAEIRRLFINHRIEAADAVQVYHRHCPDISEFLDGLDILINKTAASVGICLGRLDVAVAETGVPPVDRGQENDLLVRIVALEPAHGDVCPSLEGIVVIHELTVKPEDFSRPVDYNILVVVVIPFAHGDTVVEIIGSYEDDYGIDILSMLCLELFGLAYYLAHLVSADSVHISFYPENIPQIVPIDVIGCAYLAGICYRVSKEGDFCPIPLAVNQRLRGCRTCQHESGSAKRKDFDETVHILSEGRFFAQLRNYKISFNLQHIVLNLQSGHKDSMKMKRLMTAMLAALLCFCAAAANYPDKADYLWVTVPDHADWLYRTGENAKVEIQFYKYGIPRDAVVEYEIGGDLLPADTSGEIRLKGGRATLDIGTSRTPGFRDLRLRTTVDGKTYSHHIKLGFGVGQIKPCVKEPEDFMEFWQKNIDSAREFPLTYTMEPAEEYCTDKIDCFLVRLMLDSRQSIYGYLFFPKNAQAGSCPAVLCPPGAGVKTIKLPLRHKYYAENGCIRFEVEIHGLDPRIPAETFSQIAASFDGPVNGYLYNNLQNRDNYYMKKVYLAMVRAIDFLASLPQWDGRNMIVQGGSQGGGLSIVAAGLDPRVTQCIANHPALADMAAGAEPGRTSGYPHFERHQGILTPEAINTLSYYDVVNFARHVKAEVRMTWGYNDNTCPPTTSYAVWNVLDCPKESLITPVNEHWTSEETEYGHCMWMLEHLK